MKTEDLLAKASPRPWSTGKGREVLNGESPVDHVIMPSRYHDPVDMALIVRMSEEYETLLECEREMRALALAMPLLLGPEGSLAKLDEIRKGQA